MNSEHVRVLAARRMPQATEGLEGGMYLLERSAPNATEHSILIEQHQPALEHNLSPGWDVETR